MTYEEMVAFFPLKSKVYLKKDSKYAEFLKELVGMFDEEDLDFWYGSDKEQKRKNLQLDTFVLNGGEMTALEHLIDVGDGPGMRLEIKHTNDKVIIEADCLDGVIQRSELGTILWD